MADKIWPFATTVVQSITPEELYPEVVEQREANVAMILKFTGLWTRNFVQTKSPAKTLLLKNIT